MTHETEYLTVTLTNHPPIRIQKDEWPILAEAYWYDESTEKESKECKRLIVRQHNDGRAIVYGIYTTTLQGERNRRRGVLVFPGSELVWPIYQVSAAMKFGSDFAEDCIANLPTQVL